MVQQLAWCFPKLATRVCLTNKQFIRRASHSVHRCIQGITNFPRVLTAKWNIFWLWINWRDHEKHRSFQPHQDPWKLSHLGCCSLLSCPSLQCQHFTVTVISTVFFIPQALVSGALLINTPPTHQPGLVMFQPKWSQWNSAAARAPPIIYHSGQRSASAMWVNEQLPIYPSTGICPPPAAWQNNPSHSLCFQPCIHCTEHGKL